MAVCADVRICAAETRFAVKEVDIGLAADIGTLSRLGKVVGNGSWVKDVCLSGRIFGAEEASRVGFVSWVAKEVSVGGKGKDAVIEEALRWAAVVAGKSPVAVQGTKELLNWSRDHSVQDGESSQTDLVNKQSMFRTVHGKIKIFIFSHHAFTLYTVEANQNPFPSGLHYTSIWNSAMLQTPDVSAAMTAGIRKTKPRFEKL